MRNDFAGCERGITKQNNHPTTIHPLYIEWMVGRFIPSDGDNASCSKQNNCTHSSAYPRRDFGTLNRGSG